MTAQGGQPDGETPSADATDARSGVVTRTAANLAEAIGRLRFDGLHARGGTRLVTRAVIDWAEGLGWMPVTEMPLAFLEDTPEYPGRQGIVDVYVARPRYKTDLVIEIDRTNKGWSARKLGHAVEHGKAAIWIRWSGHEPLEGLAPPGVEVIFVSVNRPPRAQAADPTDSRVVPPGSGLSAASRALLAALFPAGPPEADLGWRDEATIWAYVATLRPRLALIVRCRFGHYAPRALTLNRTAEVVSDELGVDEVTRERIRQLEKQALRQLRARSRARVRKMQRETASSAASTGTPVSPSPADPTRAPDRRIEAPGGLARVPATRTRQRATADIDLAILRPLVIDIVSKAGAAGVRASMIGHVLRGSDGPVTRALIDRLDLPHDGALPGVPYRPLYEAILGVAIEPPLRLVDGTVRRQNPAVLSSGG
jgi:hypothetical protein